MYTQCTATTSGTSRMVVPVKRSNKQVRELLGPNQVIFTEVVSGYRWLCFPHADH